MATYIRVAMAIAVSSVVGCSSTSRNDEQGSGGAGTGATSSGGSAAFTSGGASGSPSGGRGGEAGGAEDASSGGAAGASDGGDGFDAGTCSGNPLVEYDFTVCATSCLSSGVCGTEPSCGVTYVCQFDGFDNTAPTEYFLPFEGACSGKLAFTSVGSSPAKIEFYGKGPEGDVLLDTIVSQPCITPGTKSFLLPAPMTKAILSVPYQATAHIDNVQLND